MTFIVLTVLLYLAGCQVTSSLLYVIRETSADPRAAAATPLVRGLLVFAWPVFALLLFLPADL